jgi:hypothetical protein
MLCLSTGLLCCCKIDGMKFRTLRSIVRFFMKIIADIEIQGREKLPEGISSPPQIIWDGWTRRS